MVCGGLRWFVVVCGGLRYFDGPSENLVSCSVRMVKL